MKTLRLSLVTSALTLALGLALSGNAVANTTTSAITGQVTGPQDNPAVGTVVTITHLPSGTSKRATVNASGLFSAQGLRVGGPYVIKVDSDSFADQTLNEVYLTLGETFQLNVALKTDNVERIEISGQQVVANYGSDSPSSTFDLSDLETAPTVNRDIKDLVRIDPRVYVNESGGSDSIQCAGGSPRFNSLTLDGVRMNDNFGLNGNGYPTERVPFPFAAVDQVAVELAPFDVQYGGFTACNINAVTKSGGNNVHGSMFYDYTSDSFKGDSLEGEDVPLGSYSEKRYGFDVGLPLIEDSVFLYVAYEELEGAQIFQYDAFSRIDQATLDQIVQIAKDKYDYDPGTMVPSMPVDDQKILVKLDWNINDSHRANLIYNYNDGFTLSQSDAGSSRLSLSNHFYERGAELKSIVGSLYSDWTDNFSTEVRIGRSELDNRQNSLDQSSGFGEFRIDAGPIDVYMGPDDSRQANKLNYESSTIKLAGTYYLGEHKLSFGFEQETLDVFNMFVQHNEGEYRFSSIDDFAAGIARVYYGNATSHNPEDAAGEFSYDINTYYVQDEYFVLDNDLTLTFGLRYDSYSSDDVPLHNQNFMDRYGYSNSQNLDGKDLLQPRFGFNWAATDSIEVRGGFGLYSGGNPNVWISNSYSNDGISNIQENSRNMILLGPDAVAFNGSGRPGYDIPLPLYDEVGSGTADSSTNVTDPDFEIPSEWKYALGMTFISDDDYVFTADVLLARKNDSAVIRNLADGQVGTAPDGRPVYDSINHSRNSDFLLTNATGPEAKSNVISFGVNKVYDNGFKFSASYAFVEAKDIHPMTSSVAFSNYHGIAVSDPENPQLSRSNYEIPHRFTLNMSYIHEYFEGYETKFSLFGQANEGQPWMFTFDRGSSGLGYNDASRQSLYVPAVNDPLVVYAEGVEAQMEAFISEYGLEGYRGKILPRNALDSDWWVKFDVKVEQEFMGFDNGHKASAFMVIENVGNFINDDWGILKQGSALQSAFKVHITDDNQYSYDEMTASGQRASNTASLWEIRVGVKYKF